MSPSDTDWELSQKLIEELCGRGHKLGDGRWDRRGTLDDEVVRYLIPSLRPPAPHCLGDPPIYWDEPLYKQRIPAVTTDLGHAVRILDLALGSFHNRISYQVGRLYSLREQTIGPRARADVLIHHSPGLLPCKKIVLAQSESAALCAAMVGAVAQLRKIGISMGVGR